MLPSDIRSLHEAYQSIYEESDLLTDDLIEEIVEELVEECLEFGYDLDESADAVGAAATEYLMELNPYAPAGSKQAREYQKTTTSTKRGAERSAAITGAVDRVKATARGVKAAAGIAGSIAKDELKRAGRTASHAVTHAVQKKKAEVKQGVKGLIGRGLRAVAGGIGNVAQRAAGAASKFGESVKLGENRAMARDPEGRKSGHSKQPDPSKPGFTGIGNMSIAQIAKMSARIGKDKNKNEEVEIYDVVLEYLVSEGHADTIAEAEYIMTELDSEMVNQILETRLDPRGRPASGPMNVYANPKGKPSQARLDAIAAVEADNKKKTPEQRAKELADYRERQMNNK